MTTPYLTNAAFKALTLAPAAYVDAIETAEAGWTQGRLTHWSAWINARLAKRYATPFQPAPNTPETITGWLEALVTWEVYLKRGVDPLNGQVQDAKGRHDDAKKEILDAVDLERARPELPLRNDSDAHGVVKGAPLAYTEASPYTWTTVQRDAAADEDP